MKILNLSLNEGEIFYKWCVSRIKQNKNVISATTGSTGSGKSYNDLRKAEIHYKNYFKKDFPVENCCFSIAQFMERLRDKNLQKGEILILEEAGVNSGSADWQNKIVKMFNYVLQSFRSMNIIVFMNLPVLSMLSKQARQLIHIHMETKGINFDSKKIIIKPLVHQLNQHSGKSYWKYLRTGVNGRSTAVTRITYELPSKELIKKYEKRKKNFLLGFTESFHNDIIQRDLDKQVKQMKQQDNLKLTKIEQEIVDLEKQGLNNKEIAEKMSRSASYICVRRKNINKKLEKLLLIHNNNAPALLT